MPRGSVGPWSLRRLTREQYLNTVRDLVGSRVVTAEDLAPDEAIGAFHNNAVAPVTNAMVESYTVAAERIAEAAVDELEAALPCDPGSTGEQTYAAQFAVDFGLRAYRRPLDDGELEALLDVYATGRAEGEFGDGIRLMVQAALQSPYFLYHVEIGASSDETVVPLTGYEIASRLSYTLWNTMPDDMLFATAASGELATRAGVREQAERMIQDSRTRDALASFHLQWLGLDEIDELEKDPNVFPQFDTELRRSMKRETAVFADYVVRYTDGTLGTLLTAPFTFPEGGLFTIYGIDPPADWSGSQPIPLDPARRAGLLTHPSVLAVHAHADQTSPVRRGALVREKLLCQPLPAPP